MIVHNRIVVISDLHLGGTEPAPARVMGEAKGSRINSSYAELAEFVDWITADPRPTELVLNGDIVDFLLDDDVSAGISFIESPTEACARLRRIASDCPVFDAWGRLVRSGVHCLTLLIGNHDVELSFPAVRACFAQLLGVSVHRIQFVIDGEALVRGKVLIEHGNRYDPWNWVDHDGLRHERALQSRGISASTIAKKARFIAPRGSHLVTEIMNKLKGRYRFIDLLKPETEATIPLLLKIAPALQLGIHAIYGIPLWGGRCVDFFKQDENMQPTDDRRIGSQSSVTELEQLMGENYSELHWQANLALQIDVGGFDDLLTKHVVRAVNQCANVWDDLKNALVAWTLKKANGRDSTIDPKTELNSYLTAADFLACEGKFEVVVFGHTHQPKALTLPNSKAKYLNTGTWVDTMRLDGLATISRAALKPICKDFARNHLQPYLRRYLSYAEILVTTDGTTDEADVYSFCGKANPHEPILSAYPWP